MITTADGVALHLTDEGTGRPVVLLAGYGAPARAWMLQVPALRERHRVIAVDRRNHGRSQRPSYGQRMSRHAADLHDVLEQLDLDDVMLVGHSMGASVALAYVDTFGADRLGDLVLIDQTPKMINEDGWQLGYHGLTRENAEAFVQGFPGAGHGFRTEPDSQVLLEILNDAPAFSFDQTRALLRDHTFADWRDVVERLPVRVTVLAGRHSPVWSWKSSAWIAQNAPKGQLVVFEESGHAPMLEEPEAFTAALIEVAG